MSRIVSIFFAALLTVGSFPLSTVQRDPPPADCEMCGHACCCPEACAKERKAKMDEAKACGMAFCELPAPTPSNLAQVLTEERLWKDPQMRGAGRDLVVADNAKSRIAGETTFFSTPSFKEIPTPPPRRLA